MKRDSEVYSSKIHFLKCLTWLQHDLYLIVAGRGRSAKLFEKVVGKESQLAYIIGRLVVL